ncbi:MAG: XdhC family protein [Elainellaceae cyanobacterium]
MKELQDILQIYRQQPHETAALATVVKTEGSVYRRAGARMLILPNGASVGSISGGCLESDIACHAQAAIASGEPRLVTYDAITTDDLVWGLGIGCNGRVEVLIEALTPAPHNPLALIDACFSQGQAGVLVTVFQAEHAATKLGAHLLRYPSGETVSSLQDVALLDQIRVDAETVLTQGKSEEKSYRRGTITALLEVIRPPVPLIIFGAGHDAVPMAQFAHALGWQVTVCDRRPAYATPERFPMADRLLTKRADDALEDLPLTCSTAAVIMTHSYLDDRRWLEALLPSDAGYVGMLGPRYRTERLLQEIRGGGVDFTPAQLQRLHAPIGLDIGAETPEEIAIAILSEIRAAMAGRDGRPLRDRSGPIHERPSVPCLSA